MPSSHCELCIMMIFYFGFLCVLIIIKNLNMVKMLIYKNVFKRMWQETDFYTYNKGVFFPYFMNSISILIRIKTLVRIVKKKIRNISLENEKLWIVIHYHDIVLDYRHLKSSFRKVCLHNSYYKGNFKWCVVAYPFEGFVSKEYATNTFVP